MVRNCTITAVLIVAVTGCGDLEGFGSGMTPSGSQSGTSISTESPPATGTFDVADASTTTPQETGDLEATIANDAADASTTTPQEARDAEATVANDAADAGVASDCSPGISIDSVWYFYDPYNSGRLLIDDLGQPLGQIEHSFECVLPAPPGLDDGIWSSLGPRPGTEIHAVPGHPIEEMIAAHTDSGVEIYRTADGDDLDSALRLEVVAIGINSGSLGTTRVATIDDPAMVKKLVHAARGGKAAPDSTGSGYETRYYTIALENGNGLVTVVTYAIDQGRLGDRAVGDVWHDAITQALAASGPIPTIEGLTVTGRHGTAEFHSLWTCRHDRPDLEVTPGEHLSADYDRSLAVRWWMNPPLPSGELLPTPSQTGATLIVPNFAGTMIVEASLYREGIDIPSRCITLASSDSVPTAKDRPEGLLECTNLDREPTAAEYTSDEAATFETIDDAVRRWQTDGVGAAHFGSTDVRAVISPFSSTVDVVDASGAAQAVLELSNHGDGWFIRQEFVCATD